MCAFVSACVCVRALISYGEFQSHAKKRKKRSYIVKPEMGCQGRGIWMTRNASEISPFDRMLCQHYISKVEIVCLYLCVCLSGFYRPLNGHRIWEVGVQILAQTCLFMKWVSVSIHWATLGYGCIRLCSAWTLQICVTLPFKLGYSLRCLLMPWLLVSQGYVLPRPAFVCYWPCNQLSITLSVQEVPVHLRSIQSAIPLSSGE